MSQNQQINNNGEKMENIFKIIQGFGTLLIGIASKI